MIKNKIILLICIIASISCNELSFREDSTLYSKTFELANFNQIIINSSSNITLVQSDSRIHQIKGYVRQVEQTNFTIKNNTLTIDGDYKNFTKNHNPLEIILNVNELNSIICEKNCQIKTMNALQGNVLSIKLLSSAQVIETNLQLHYNMLEFLADGSLSGKYTISGKSGNSNFTLNGLGSLHAENYICDTLHIINFSRGDHYIHVTKKLTAVFHSSSNIYYRGEPIINVSYEKINSVEPSGKLIKID